MLPKMALFPPFSPIEGNFLFSCNNCSQNPKRMRDVCYVQGNLTLLFQHGQEDWKRHNCDQALGTKDYRNEVEEHTE